MARSRAAKVFFMNAILVEAVFILFFAVFTRYEADPAGESTISTDLSDKYNMFQDVNVMMFIGFGFLMTFLKKYCWSSAGFNFFISALMFQWHVLTGGFFHRVFSSTPFSTYISISITELITSNYAVAAVLISWGACLGRVQPIQLMWMGLFEMIVYTCNEFLVADVFGVADIGGSMIIHAFGAYFGLSVSWMLHRHAGHREALKKASHLNESRHTTDLFAMIGTLFLWMFWPSFNAALAVGSVQHRTVINTVLSLCGSCVSSFLFSTFLRSESKFNMVDVQNATLAGGVAIGAAANMLVQPFGAILIGSLAGFLSVFGYVYIMPKLTEKIALHDTCGVHNLHGMPGVFGALVSIVAAAIATEAQYGTSGIAQVFSKRPGRSASVQALFQLASLGTTLGIAIGGGLLTGFLLVRLFENPKRMFEDEENWETPDESLAPVPHNTKPSAQFGSNAALRGNHNEDEIEMSKMQLSNGMLSNEVISH